MNQAIRIRYIPASNTKPTRLSVKTSGGSILIKSVDYFERIADESDLETDHPDDKKYLAAAVLMCEKMNWPIDGLTMGMFNNDVYVTLP